MDNCESDKRKETEGEKSKDGDPLPYVGNVFSTIWLRCTIQTNNGLDKFLLDYGYNFLLPVGSFIWIVFLLFKA